jgi:hypothetical protein
MWQTDESEHIPEAVAIAWRRSHAGNRAILAANWKRFHRKLIGAENSRVLAAADPG